VIGKRTCALATLLLAFALVSTGCEGIAQHAASDPTPAPTVIALQAAAATESASTEPPVTPEPLRTPTAEAPSPAERPAPPVDEDVNEVAVITKGDGDRREIALTFDGGADRGNAELILDFLAERGIVASFGITGQWAAANRDLLRRMVDEGHMVVNHTWNHYSFTGRSTKGVHPGVLTTEERQKELTDTERAIATLTGYDPKPYYRSTYGDYDDSVLADVAGVGYYITLEWSCDSLGWRGASAAEIVERCGANAAPGDILLLHVGADSDDWLALPELIETLAAQGLALVTAEELLRP